MAKKVDDQTLIDTANDIYSQYCKGELKVTDMEASVKKINAMQYAINLLLKRGYSYTADYDQGTLQFQK